jgi:hypothetical protein
VEPPRGLSASAAGTQASWSGDSIRYGRLRLLSTLHFGLLIISNAASLKSR